MGNYICHHGIKGQKWGDKNGPPYPLDKSVSAKIKKRAEENKDTNKPKEGIRVKIQTDPFGLATRELEDTYYPGYDRVMDPEKLHPSKLTQQSSIDNAAREVNKWSIGHPIGGGTYNCSNCAIAYELRRRGYDVVSRSEIDGTKMKDITTFFPGSKEINIDDNIKKDPLFNDPRIKSIYQKYDKLMEQERKSGKDPKEIKSKEWDFKYDREDEIWSEEFSDDMDKMIDKLSQLRFNATNKLCETLLKMPDGSRGAITLGWSPEVGWESNMFAGKTATSFHAISYEKQKGTVYIVDSQSGDVTSFKNLKDANNGWPVIDVDYVDPRNVSYIPLDSLEFDKNKVVDAVTSWWYKRR